MFVNKGSCIFRVESHEGDHLDCVFMWTSNASGDVEVYCGPDEIPSGYVYSVITDPLDTPTSQYDVYFYDTHGIDMLRGIAANRSSTASEKVHMIASGAVRFPRIEPDRGPYRFVVSGAGNAKSGEAHIHVISKEDAYNIQVS